MVMSPAAQVGRILHGAATGRRRYGARNDVRRSRATQGILPDIPSDGFTLVAQVGICMIAPLSVIFVTSAILSRLWLPRDRRCLLEWRTQHTMCLQESTRAHMRS